MAVSVDIRGSRRAIVAGLEAAREHTLALVAPLSREQLERQIDPLMSPLVWDLAHIAAYEDLWLVHRHAGEPLLRADLAATYDAFETPRAVRGEIELLDAAGALDYLADVRERTLRAIDRARRRPGAARDGDPARAAAHGDDAADAAARPDRPATSTPAGARRRPHLAATAAWNSCPSPAGRSIWAPRTGASRTTTSGPRHHAEVEPFLIARTPVTNATWLEFAEGGGYERREWWCEEAWAWKQEYDITHPLHWARRPDGAWIEHTVHGPRPLDPDRPAAHVSWFEAAAVATRARRPAPHRDGVGDGGDLGPAHRRSRVRERSATSASSPSTRRRSGAFPGGASACGALDLLGNVWEWTASEFGGYPGFSAAPLPRVLGGLLRQGLPRAARRLVGDAGTRRDARPSATGTCHSAARSSAACGWPATGANVSTATARSGALAAEPFVIDSYLRPGDERSLADDVLDGLTRPFKELPPKHFYDARGAELFDRICELPEYYPTRAERSILVSRAAQIAQLTRRRRGRRARLGHGGEDARAAGGAAHRRHAAPLRPARRDAGDGRALCARADRARRGPPRARHRRRLRAPPRARAAAGRRARGSSRSSAARSATSRRARGGASCAASASCCGPGVDHLLLGTDLVKDTRVLEAAYDDSARRHGGVQPQRAARDQPRARRRLRRRRCSSTSRSSTPSASGSRCACARPCASRWRSPPSGSSSSSPRARSCAPRSARSSRSSGSRRTSARPGSRSSAC